MLSVLSSIRKKIKTTLDDFVIMRRGVLFNPELLTERKSSDQSFPYFEGDVYRYQTNYYAPKWVEFGPKMSEYPRDFHWFKDQRILLRRLVNRQQRLMASLVSTTVITNKNLYVIKNKSDFSIEFLLAIINSKLFSRIYLSQVSQATKDDYAGIPACCQRQSAQPRRDIHHRHRPFESQHLVLASQSYGLHRFGESAWHFHKST